jgi:hypothetical protein
MLFFLNRRMTVSEQIGARPARVLVAADSGKIGVYIRIHDLKMAS